MKKVMSISLILILITQSSFAQPSAAVSVTNDQLNNFFNTRNIKLVFVDDSRLYYVDFSENNPEIRKLINVPEAAIPVISPNGDWIAFATGTQSDGQTSSKSTAWICRLEESASPIQISEPEKGYVPRFIQSALDTPTVFFSTCATPTAAAEYVWDGCGEIISKKIINNSLGTKTDTIVTDGSWLGGISFDNRYMVTAENTSHVFFKDLNNPAANPIPVHDIDVIMNGETTTLAIQVCNSSASSSRRYYTNTVLYVDFGIPDYIPIEPIDMPTWTFHERLFITDIDNNILRYYDVPGAPEKNLGLPLDQKGGGEVVATEWSYPEWSNHPYFAVVSHYKDRLWKGNPYFNHTYRREIIKAINLKDSSYIDLITATDTSEQASVNMSFPWLWIEIPDNFKEANGWLELNSSVHHDIFHKFGNSFLGFGANTITTKEKINSIKIVSLNGRILWQRHGINSHTVTLPDLMNPSGLTFIQVNYIDGTCLTAKYPACN